MAGSECLTWGVPNALWSESIGHTAVSQSPSTFSWPRGFVLRYDLEEVIGHGASSEVFAARARSSGESVAVKRVFKKRCCVGARATRRLRDEVRVLSKLKHAHVIEMREVWETPTELYIVMERAHGGELFDRIVDKGNFTEAQAKTVMRQLLSALSEMHRRGVIHRDVKPENLLLTTKTGWDIKLSDFGLVKTLEDDDRPSEAPAVPKKTNETTPKNSTFGNWEPPVLTPCTQQKEDLPTVSPGDETVRAMVDADHFNKRQRRPSWGEALETVDERNAAEYTHSHTHTEGGGLSRHSLGDLQEEFTTEDEKGVVDGVNYYYSTAGVDVQLNGGPFVASVDQQIAPVVMSDFNDRLSEGGEGKKHSSSYALSEEEAFALLPALDPLQTADTTEREVAMLFRSARTHTLCGSPYYMAPEVCDRERYGPAVDVWSAGVVMYILLTGSPPWDRPPQFRAPPPLDMHELSQVSRIGVDLLLKMLKAIPEERCTAAEALLHPWLSSPQELMEQNMGLSPRFESAIKNFCEKRKRGAANTNLDMTPVARALEDNVYPHAFTPTTDSMRLPRPESQTVEVKRNRRASPTGTLQQPQVRSRPRQVQRPQHFLDGQQQTNDYDTFSSDGSDDDDDNDDDDSDDQDEGYHHHQETTTDLPHLLDEPSSARSNLPYHDPFRLSLDAEPLPPTHQATTW